MIENKFVLCVVGKKEYIQEINYSLDFLRFFSKNEIIVITDTSRNEAIIQHDKIINVKTPVEFNHHQAAIFLKTGAHKYLDFTNTKFCYLDTDIYVISDIIDEVFSHFVGPISFCSDQSTIRTFSKNAVNLPVFPESYKKIDTLKEIDTLLKEFKNKSKSLNNKTFHKKTLKMYKSFWIYQSKNYWTLRLFSKFNLPNSLKYFLFYLGELFTFNKKAFHFIPFLLKYIGFYLIFAFFSNRRRAFSLNTKKKIIRIHNEINNNLNDCWLKLIKYYPFCESKGYKLDLKNECWTDLEGNIIHQNNPLFHHLRNKFDCFIDPNDPKKIRLPNGEILKSYENSEGFTFLAEKKFGVKIKDLDFNQWNGGLFIFDESSIDFLDTWHNYTMETFKDDNWKTRDQGTLIVTVWKYGLENHPRVPKTFNRLIPMDRAYVTYYGDFTFKVKKEYDVKPVAIHFFNGMGPEDGQIFKDLEVLRASFSKV